MEDRMIAKRYYRIEFKLASALAVGSGENEETDKDLVRDSRGVPYIPASALAGIYRSLFDETRARHYFGYINSDGEAQDSRLFVYDAVMKSGEDYKVSVRDCVGLDDKKTALDGAKFDFEILEPGVTFVTYIEQDKYKGDDDVGDIIAKAWIDGKISAGSKVSRGLGRTKDAKIEVREFSFEKEADIDEWIDFSLDSDSYEELELSENTVGSTTNGLSLRLVLAQKSPISIRVYSSAVDEVDYQQLTYLRKVKDNVQEIPVIPGTSWAGAFRHQMKKLDSECPLDDFGNSEGQKSKSKIQFSESEINGASGKILTRNAIDRFTGGTVEHALFSEREFYGGKTELVINLPANTQEKFLRCFCAAVVDLHMGILSIGGETSVGHGIFEIEEAFCGDSEIKLGGPDTLYVNLLNSLLEHRREGNKQ